MVEEGKPSPHWSACQTRWAALREDISDPLMLLPLCEKPRLKLGGTWGACPVCGREAEGRSVHPHCWTLVSGLAES